MLSEGVGNIDGPGVFEGVEIEPKDAKLLVVVGCAFSEPNGLPKLNELWLGCSAAGLPKLNKFELEDELAVEEPNKLLAGSLGFAANMLNDGADSPILAAPNKLGFSSGLVDRPNKGVDEPSVGTFGAVIP